ncbi:hypothetical protein C7974DRAFT_178177 [Boeremia exigua]|uniref:uncharacterized protein n=1 Tax=Boeremia exigua TaxID=749465 RepID=UPI001E8D35CB|nr:uncharacterized protein C7974DRAFT_178177 [Boeremia exigua]KAH6633795.1 hypothetical protein C7974DRAFT_178177 [Boeremia exigua]
MADISRSTSKEESNSRKGKSRSGEQRKSMFGQIGQAVLAMMIQTECGVSGIARAYCERELRDPASSLRIVSRGKEGHSKRRHVRDDFMVLTTAPVQRSWAAAGCAISSCGRRALASAHVLDVLFVACSVNELKQCGDGSAGLDKGLVVAVIVGSSGHYGDGWLPGGDFIRRYARGKRVSSLCRHPERRPRRRLPIHYYSHILQ